MKTATNLCVAAITLTISAALLFAQKTEHVFRLWTKAELVDVAAVHASKFAKENRKFLRYFDLASTPPRDRPKRLKALGYVVNSLSRNDEIALVPDVPGTEGALAYVDLSQLRERGDRKGLELLVKAFDRLGELGSGPAPFREPYYHADVEAEVVVSVEKEVTEEYTVDTPAGTIWNGYAYVQSYRRETRYRVVKVPSVKKVAKNAVGMGAHLNKATAVGLVAITETPFPIFQFDWFVTNALVEPRYHELLGLGDHEADYLELAAADPKLADRRGAQVRGAVLFSEVAHHNRILERTPTILCYGKGVYQTSYDFLTSIKLQNVLDDLLAVKSDAKEVIFSLPNGLLGFAVFDGKGKRLDKADGDVAANRRSRFRDTQVRTAYHCIACHLPDRGWIEVDDEVRSLATKPIELHADADERRGDRIRRKYLVADFNALLTSDQAVVEAAVEAATRAGSPRGLTCPETSRVVIDCIVNYLQSPVTLQQLAAELGYPQDEVLAACQTAGLDAVFIVLRAGRKVRRDQIEASFAQIAYVLHKGK